MITMPDFWEHFSHPSLAEKAGINSAKTKVLITGREISYFAFATL